MTVLTSRHNPRVKEARSLALKKERGLAGRYLLEGVRLLEEAVAAGVPLLYCLYTDKLVRNDRGRALLDRLMTTGVACLPVKATVLDAVTATKETQGIVAVAPIPAVSWETVLTGDQFLVVVVDGVQDPGNLGTVIRTAEGAGANGVLLTPGTVDPFNPKVIRAAMGSLFRLPVTYGPEPEALVEGLQTRGGALVVGDAHGGVAYDRADWRAERLALVIGSEAQGPRPCMLAQAGQVVRIPLMAPVESLNVAVAAAVLLFEAARQRRIPVQGDAVASGKGL
ncbi:MAG: RNA methyltransferase [Heliobacteriaceae bacterium]|nr:RNA methyltransferase [Heliobacteriaceae bacterium]MDD4587574.1 RNA methyltransferase [Heliobacteriaceae bacterium]